MIADPERIAIVKPSALGDVMNSLPVLTALRRRFPRAHISWIVNRAFEPLLLGHPDLNETIPFDRNAIRKPIAGALAMVRFVKELRKRRFDLAIDLQGLFRTGLIAYLTGARRRLGLASAREGASWFYTEVVEDRSGSPHAVDRCWRVAEHLGADGEKIFRVPLEPSAQAWAHDLLADHPRPWLALAVGSRWLTKRWPPEHFAELARRTQQTFGGSVILVGAPDEADLARHTAEIICRLRLSTPYCAKPQAVGSTLNVVGKTSLGQLAALLALADVVLSNDTGPLHLAVALGRPVVAPYTCTKVSHNGPYGQFDSAVETRVYCQGSYLRQCGRLDCMAELTPDRLWPILHGILQSVKQEISACA